MDQNVTQSKVLTISTEQLRLFLYNQGFLQRVRVHWTDTGPVVMLAKTTCAHLSFGLLHFCTLKQDSCSLCQIGWAPRAYVPEPLNPDPPTWASGEKIPWIISFLTVTTLWWEAFKLFLRHSWRVDLYLMSGIIVGCWVSKQENTNAEM